MIGVTVRMSISNKISRDAPYGERRPDTMTLVSTTTCMMNGVIYDTICQVFLTKISNGGGSSARWRGDGAEIFYIAPDRTLMAVEVKSDGETFELSSPRPLFQTRISGPLDIGVRCNYAVSPDGERFLIATDVGESIPAQIHVVLNWTADLER